MESWKAGWDRNLQMIECSFPLAWPVASRTQSAKPSFVCEGGEVGEGNEGKEKTERKGARIRRDC